MANQIEVEIIVELKKAQEEIKGLQKQMEDLADETKKGIDSMDVAVAAFAANLATIAFEKIVDGAKALFNFMVVDGVKAAQEQEDSINKLNLALQNTGRFTAQASEDLQKFASSLQETTRFSDDAILANMALLQSLADLSTEGLKQGTQAALDMSAALGIDLKTATMAVAKAANGEVGALKKFGIEIVKGADDAETFARALDALNAKFGGSASGQVTTFSGAMDVLKNQINELQESFGNMIIQNPAVISAIQKMIEIAQELGVWIEANKKEFDDFIAICAKVAVFLAETLSGSIKFVITLFEQLKTVVNGFVIVLDGMQTGSLDKMVAGLDQMAAGMLNNTGITGDYNKVLLEQQAIIDQNAKADAAYAIVNKQIADENAKVMEEKKKKQQEEAKAKEAEQAEQERLRQAEIEAEKKKVADLLAVQTAYAEASKEQKIAQAELDAVADEEGKIVEQEFLKARLDELEQIKIDARIKEAELVGNHYEALRLMQEKALLTNQQAVDKANVKFFDTEKAKQDFEKKTTAQKFTAASQGMDALVELQNVKSKEAFAVGKAAAIAQTLLSIPESAQKAYGALAGIPIVGPALGAAAAAAAVISGIARLNQIKSASPGFAEGGLVPGNSYSGDAMNIRANSGEMILNKRQQENLFNTIDSGSMGGGTVINISGNVYADDESQIQKLIQRINDATEFNNIKLRV